MVMRIVPCEWHMFLFHARFNLTRSKSELNAAVTLFRALHVTVDYVLIIPIE